MTREGGNVSKSRAERSMREELRGMSNEGLRARMPIDMTRESLNKTRYRFRFEYDELKKRPRTDGVKKGTLLDQFFPRKGSYGEWTDAALLAHVPSDEVLLRASTLWELRHVVGVNLYEELATRGLHTQILEKAKNLKS